MLKLIGIILAAIPVVLFLRSLLKGPMRRSRAVAEFKKQIDYLVWVILILIGCGVIYFVYSVGKLILT